MKKAMYFLSGSIFSCVLAAGFWAYADSPAQVAQQTDQKLVQGSQQTAGTLSFDQMKHLEFKWECADNKWIGSYQNNNNQVQAAIESRVNGTVRQISGDQAIATIRHLFDQLPTDPQLVQKRIVQQFSPDLYVATGAMELQIDLMDGQHDTYQFKDGTLVSFNQSAGANSQERPKANQGQNIARENGQGTQARENGQGTQNVQTGVTANQQNTQTSMGAADTKHNAIKGKDKDKSKAKDKDENKDENKDHDED